MSENLQLTNRNTRWDKPFSEDITDDQIKRILNTPPFNRMQDVDTILKTYPNVAMEPEEMFGTISALCRFPRMES